MPRYGYQEDVKQMQDVGGPFYDPYSEKVNFGLGLRNSVTMALAYNQWKKEQEQKEMSQRMAMELQQAQIEQAKRPSVEQQKWDYLMGPKVSQPQREQALDLVPEGPKAAPYATPSEYGTESKFYKDMLQHYGITDKAYRDAPPAQRATMNEDFQKLYQFNESLKASKEAAELRGGGTTKTDPTTKAHLHALGGARIKVNQALSRARSDTMNPNSAQQAEYAQRNLDFIDNLRWQHDSEQTPLSPMAMAAVSEITSNPYSDVTSRESSIEMGGISPAGPQAGKAVPTAQGRPGAAIVRQMAISAAMVQVGLDPNGPERVQFEKDWDDMEAEEAARALGR